MRDAAFAFLFRRYNFNRLKNVKSPDPDRNYGFNVFGEKKLNKIFTLSGGFANIHIKALNADRFPPGKRIYLSAIVKLTREFNVTTQFTKGVGYISPTTARTRFDIIFNFNILESLRRTKFF